MSIWGRRVPVKVVATIVVALIFAAVGVALSRPAPREITLVMRGMAFYMDGSELPNPPVTVRAGERVRIVLRNEDRGIMHDFAVPAAGATLDPLGWNESGDVTFEVPEKPGSYEYHCRPHMMMMRGTIVVR